MTFSIDFENDGELPVTFLTLRNASIQVSISIDRSCIEDLAGLLSRDLGGLKIGQCCGQPVFWSANQRGTLCVMIGDGTLRNVTMTLDRESVSRMLEVMK